jgi:hypothetical protein
MLFKFAIEKTAVVARNAMTRVKGAGQSQDAT